MKISATKIAEKITHTTNICIIPFIVILSENYHSLSYLSFIANLPANTKIRDQLFRAEKEQQALILDRLVRVLA